MNKKQQDDWWQIVSMEYMCGRLLVMEYGENGLQDIDHKYVQRFHQLCRSIKTKSSNIRKLYYEYVVLSNTIKS